MWLIANERLDWMDSAKPSFPDTVMMASELFDVPPTDNAGYPRQALTLAIVAAFIALVGQAIIPFDDFGAGSNSLGRGSARMVTAAALSKAGAIETWPEPAPGRITR
jgi:hypothetical protein